MKDMPFHGALRVSFALVGLLWSAFSHAGVVQMDQFVVTKNGSGLFTDAFSNGQTPSQESSTYGVFGAFPSGAESGGRLTLDSDWGALSQNAAGQARRTLNTTLLTNINAANPNSGLTRASTMTVTGTFDFAIPSGPLINAYGVRVADGPAGGGQADRLVELDVQYNANFGGNVIRYLLQDFTNNTITTLGFVALAAPLGADQISLMISRPDINNDDFFGAYAFGTGGVFGSFVGFSNAGALFTNTNFVRAQFHIFSEVPEPATIALLGLGLAGLAASRRRRQ